MTNSPMTNARRRGPLVIANWSLVISPPIMRLIFIGPPGAGKGTQAQRLIKHLATPHISTGELLRDAVARRTPQGLAAKAHIDRGALAPDELILEIINERISQGDCAGGCLFDGFPRTVAQARALDELLARRGEPLDGAIELAVDEETLFHRLVARGRDDDQPDVIRERFASYQRQTAPVLDYYRRRGILETVSGAGAPDEVFDRIRAAVDRLKSNDQ
jgi:adenylate kinase